MLKKLRRALCLLTSRIKWQGWAHPMWFVYRQKEYKLTGWDKSRIMQVMGPGAIVITRTEGIISTWLIPGWWTHGGICTESGCVIHSTAKGVHESHPLDFLQADYAIVLRPKDMVLGIHAASIAQEIEGAKYDFGFDFEDSSEFACTEVVMYCYPGLIKPVRKFLWKRVVLADDIVALADPAWASCGPFRVVYDTRTNYGIH